MNDRRKFLKTAGSTALFTSLGSSFFISCDDANDDVTPNPNPIVSENGYTKDGNVYTIDLNHSNFSILKTEGGFKKFNEGGMLIVNVGQNIIRAFSNACPHDGCRTSWTYSNKNITCTCHTSIFTNDGTFVSGPANSDLDSYNASLDNNILTVTV